MPDYALTRIPSAQVPVVDPTTGLMSREWFRFFNACLSSLAVGLPKQPALLLQQILKP